MVGHVSEALWPADGQYKAVTLGEKSWERVSLFFLFSSLVKTLSDINQEQNTYTALGVPKSLDGLRSDIIYFKK